MIAANRTENPEKRMLKMKKILHELPPEHFDTFHYLADHLYKVQQHQDKNKVHTHFSALNRDGELSTARFSLRAVSMRGHKFHLLCVCIPINGIVLFANRNVQFYPKFFI